MDPVPWIVGGYVGMAISCWIAGIALAVAEDQHDKDFPLTIVVPLFLALVWPLTLLAVSVWRAGERLGGKIRERRRVAAMSPKERVEYQLRKKREQEGTVPSCYLDETVEFAGSFDLLRGRVFHKQCFCGDCERVRRGHVV